MSPCRILWPSQTSDKSGFRQLLTGPWKEIPAQTIPNPPRNPPAARAVTNQFSQKSCKSPGNRLHWSLQPPFVPAALPQLDTLRPMNTVCPSYQCPPTMPSAPPHTQPSLAASVSLLQSSTCRTSTKALFWYVSDRLRSSQIVSDRLGSSEPTASHRPPFPQNCRNVRPIPPAIPAN